MMRQFKQHVLSARFSSFVLMTMISSILVGGIAAGLASFVITGEPAMLLFVPFVAMVGGGFAIPAALLLWIAPSALIFSASMSFIAERVGEKQALRWSGSITALAASGVTAYVATNFGRDFDDAGFLMIFVGPVSVCIAPWAVNKAYNLSVT